MKMYKYLILIISLISLQSCGQNNKAMDGKATESLGNLYKDVKYYDQRINYHADIVIGGCNYEVLINDFPVDSYYGPGNGAVNTSIPINTAILHKGEQTWKIRVYPVHDNKEVNGGTAMIARPAIQDGARVEIKIEGVRFKENGSVEQSFGRIVDFKAPTKKDDKTGKNIFADTDKPYVEYSGTFNTETPYSLTGWEKSEDLTKIDSTALTQQLLKEYQKFHQWIQNKDLNAIAQATLTEKKEYAQALFFDKKDNDNMVNSFMKGWGQKGLTMYPIENYKIKIYGDGKLVTLQRADHIGDPVLAGWYMNDNNARKLKTFSLYFHIPKGKKELEVIR
ncbi:hypothetical protein KRE40_10845 [Elizabethkingia meningoseptica]|nr:hypothetical protein [Elizabethkingia meningoseptica]MDE5509144.1 hypothetical protein [Elizabethkingia meningoseptica]MDE5514661.1 hypothetical protein [Elizabethkingia meningoseptica]MDE5525347.1 hypothetical protein [Elizabethkingia meningoseptica]MDE5528927.1 hypothetical protein [Elizabethkingia meningoseptica]